jgi:hypothetical protein
MSFRLILVLGLIAACGGDGLTDAGDDEPIGGSRTVTGSVVDFETGAAIGGAASVSTSGVLPAPRVTVAGADYTIDGIPDNSLFQVLAAAPPTHRPTFGPSIEVVTDDLAGIEVPTVRETFLENLATAFLVTPSAANGVLIARLVDGAGAPRAGISGGDIVIAGGVDGPHFLDANMAPDPAANASSASGYVVFFEVPPGVVTVGQAVGADVTLEMPASPVNPAVVTIADITVTNGAPDLPTNVSLSRDVAPIFANRGCVACHSGGGVGKELAGLKLDGPSTQVFAELVEEDPTRVRTGEPETSLILTMPSRESPADTHPNVTFTSPTDPDYLKILVWIREGAKNN